MNVHRLKEIQGMIRRHQEALKNVTPREIPVGAGRDTDDLSKVASNDVIGKGGESDLRK